MWLRTQSTTRSFTCIHIYIYHSVVSSTHSFCYNIFICVLDSTDRAKTVFCYDAQGLFLCIYLLNNTWKSNHSTTESQSGIISRKARTYQRNARAIISASTQMLCTFRRESTKKEAARRQVSAPRSTGVRLKLKTHQLKSIKWTRLANHRFVQQPKRSVVMSVLNPECEYLCVCV